MSSSQALAKIAPDPGARYVPWQAVEQFIRSNDITEVGSLKMPYMEGVTVGEFIEQLYKGSPATQREALDDWMAAAVTEFDTAAAMIHLISHAALSIPNLVAQYGGAAEFKSKFPTIKTAVDYNKRRMKESASALERIRGNLGGGTLVGDIVAPFSSSSLMSHECLTNIAYCLGRVEPRYLCYFVNSALYRRLANPRRRKDNFINTSDWQTAHDAIALFQRDIQSFLANKAGAPPGERHNLVELAIDANLQNPATHAGDYTVSLLGDQSSGKYKFWEAAFQHWQTMPPANMYQLDGKPTTFIVSSRIQPDFLSEKRLCKHPSGFLVPQGAGSDSSRARINTISTTPSPQRARMLAKSIADVRSAGRASASPGGSPLAMTQPFDFRGSASQPSRSPSISGNIVQSIERDSSRLSSIAADDLDNLAEEAGYRVGEGQDRAVQSIRGTQTNAQRARFGSVASVPEDHRAQEQSAIRSTEFRSLDDAAGETAVYPGDREAAAQQEEAAIGAEAYDELQGGTQCRCADSRSALVQLCTSIGKAQLSDRDRAKLLRAWVRECCHEAEPIPKSVDGKDVTHYTLNSDRVCWPHLRYVAGKMGLLIRSMSRSTANNTLMMLHYYPDRWGAWRSDPRTRILFQNYLRTANTMDSLQSYRYRPVPARVSVDWDAFLDRHSSLGYRDMVNEFKQSGTAVVSVFNEILQDPELQNIVTRSYEMYDYHTRMIHGKDNLGWCRVMYHSLVQQLVRGDLEYWLLYAVLRRETNFVSYPYYTKYTKKGDATFFRHVDCNLADAVANGRGAAMIQGSVSFDNEDETNCTEMLSGFHNHIGRYLKWRQDNNIDRRNGYIEGWKDERDYPSAIQKELGCKWTKYPCQAGQVRISHPLLPHGSTGPATKQRRTALPWFVLVTEDGSTMEVPEMGSYEDLASAHRALRAGPASPSGHGNKFGGAPYAFPADITPDFTSWISKAVHCQARYDSWPVTEEIHTLCTTMNSEQLQARIKEVRAANVAMVKKHWAWVQAAEQKAFRADAALKLPNRSFFANQGKHPQHTPGWERWDGQQTRDGALSKMFSGMKIKADDPARWDPIRVDTSSEGSSDPPASPTPGPSKSRVGASTQQASRSNTAAKTGSPKAGRDGGRYNTRASSKEEKGKGRA